MPLRDVLLWSILGGVLAGPFASRRIERNLELFLLVMGALAVTSSAQWSRALIWTALHEPLALTAVVLVVGYGFHFGRSRFVRLLEGLQGRLPVRLLVPLLVFALGLLASMITAIIAAIVIVEAITVLRLRREDEVRIAILACYSIGLGAALTPVGEPLSTIVVAKMGAGFWFLLLLVGPYILPGVLAVSIYAGSLRYAAGGQSLRDLHPERGLGVPFWRAARVFVFVAALMLLGAGLSPLVDRYIVRLPAPVLFWVNMVSAVLDNATLAAAETGPSLTSRQLTAVLLGLLVSGGMLIPGNVPNIIAANHLGIRSREWARFAVPLGLVLMTLYFGAWLLAQS